MVFADKGSSSVTRYFFTQANSLCLIRCQGPVVPTSLLYRQELCPVLANLFIGLLHQRQQVAEEGYLFGFDIIDCAEVLGNGLLRKFVSLAVCYPKEQVHHDNGQRDDTDLSAIWHSVTDYQVSM